MAVEMMTLIWHNLCRALERIVPSDTTLYTTVRSNELVTCRTWYHEWKRPLNSLCTGLVGPLEKRGRLQGA